MKKCEYCGSSLDVVEVRESDLWVDLCLKCREEELIV